MNLFFFFFYPPADGEKESFISPHFHVFSYASCVDLTIMNHSFVLLQSTSPQTRTPAPPKNRGMESYFPPIRRRIKKKKKETTSSTIIEHTAVCDQAPGWTSGRREACSSLERYNMHMIRARYHIYTLKKLRIYDGNTYIPAPHRVVAA